MRDAVRPPYLEELPPTQRVPDYVPARPATAPALPTVAIAPPQAEATDGAAPLGTITAATPVDNQTVKRTGQISSPVHQVQRPTGLAISFTLLVTEGEDRTTTYRVYATKQFAERLAKQELVQGALVEVAGQPQLRQERQPDGSSLPVPYLYCFGVRVLTTAAP